mgnify:CR=1 FL=1
MPERPANPDSNTRALDRYAAFEASALTRLQRETGATALLPLPVRLTAIAAAGLSGLGVLWSLLAQVPIQVEGTAAFVPSQGIGSLVAATSGRLLFQVSGLGPSRLSASQQRINSQLSQVWGWNHQSLRRAVAPEGDLTTLVKAALEPPVGEHLVLPEELEGPQAFDQRVSAPVVHYPAGTVLARIVDPISNQELNSVLLSTELAAPQSSEGDNRRRLANQLIDNLHRTAVFAPEGGFYLLAKFVRNGSHVNQGDELLSYTSQPPALPEVVPIFLDGPMAEQVNDNMEVLVTPRGISRAAYGGIRGTVIEVNKLPLLGAGITGAVGSRSLARTIEQRRSAPYLVWVRLQLAEPRYCHQTQSRRCYRWSSGRRPPHPVRLATLADALITTGRQRPITVVMPALRRALGLVTDNQ